MIYGVGTDIIETARIAKAWDRWGARFEKRIFTSREVEACRPRPHPASSLAMCFAAKEAFSKAVGIGLRSARLVWRDIEVNHDRRGKPFLVFHNTASVVAEEIGLLNCQLSLTDDSGLAMAFVVVEV